MKRQLLLLVIYLTWSHIRCEDTVASNAEKAAGNAIKDLLNEKISEKFKEAANEVKGVLVKQLGSSLKSAHTGMQKGQSKEKTESEAANTTPAPLDGNGTELPGNVSKTFYEKSKPTRPNPSAGAATHQQKLGGAALDMAAVGAISQNQKLNGSLFGGANAVTPHMKDKKLKALDQGGHKPKPQPKHKAVLSTNKHGAQITAMPAPGQNKPAQAQHVNQLPNQQQQANNPPPSNPATQHSGMNPSVMNQPPMAVPQPVGVPLMVPVPQPCYGNMCNPCTPPNCQNNMNNAVFQPACPVTCTTSCLPFCPQECCKMKKKSSVSKKGQKKSKKN